MRGPFHLAERERETGCHAESLAALTPERSVLGADPLDTATDGTVALSFLAIGK